jgi:hypothetical protein
MSRPYKALRILCQQRLGRFSGLLARVGPVFGVTFVAIRSVMYTSAPALGWHQGNAVSSMPMIRVAGPASRTPLVL